MAWYTGKNGRYTGAGDPTNELIVGEAAPANSPFYWMPFNLETRDDKFVHWSLNEGYVAANWTETLVDVGSGTTAWAMGAAGLVLTGAGNEDDGGQIQFLRAFTPAAGKYATMAWRMECSEATQYDWWAGWSNTDTAIIASAPTVSAGFRKDDGDTIVNGTTNDAGGATDTANLITDFAAATQYDFGVVINGVTNVTFHYKLASSSVWTKVAKTTDLPNAAVRPSFAGLNGEAAADTMTLVKARFAWTL